MKINTVKWKPSEQIRKQPISSKKKILRNSKPFQLDTCCYRLLISKLRKRFNQDFNLGLLNFIVILGSSGLLNHIHNRKVVLPSKHVIFKATHTLLQPTALVHFLAHKMSACNNKTKDKSNLLQYVEIDEFVGTNLVNWRPTKHVKKLCFTQNV